MKILLALLIIVNSVFCLNISDIKFPDQIKVGDKQLILNGAGVREKWFLDLYVGGLYLEKKNKAPFVIIAKDDTMAIKLHIVSVMITSEKMKKATLEGFENSTNDNIKPIKKEIDRFIASFKEEIKENDVYDFIYLPGKGTEVYKNSKLFDTIEGLEFKKALFGIWLGKEPAQDDLKDDMLGK